MKSQGSCHCGDITFWFEHEESIDSSLRCNCSICMRKGAMMTPFVIAPEQFNSSVKDGGELGIYEFDNKIAKHYFCKSCGIFTFNQTLRMPGFYRANLGCIEGIDPFLLEERVFDGKAL